MDIELAVDVLDLAPHLDHVVLFSGDGDFRRLVEAVQGRGVRVTVISTIRTQPAMIADELRRQADAFIDLTDLAEHITRRQMEVRQRAGSVAARPVPLRAAPSDPFLVTSDLPERSKGLTTAAHWCSPPFVRPEPPGGSLQYSQVFRIAMLELTT